jgi:predicted transcriptional regulator
MTTGATVARIRECLAAADTAHAEVAKLMRELQDEGRSQRWIAREVGCSQATVSRHVRWAELPEPRPSYTDWLDDLKSQAESKDQVREAEKRADALREAVAQVCVAQMQMRAFTRRMYEDRAYHPDLMLHYDCRTLETFARQFWRERENEVDRLHQPWEVRNDVAVILAATDEDAWRLAVEGHQEEARRMGEFDPDELRWIIDMPFAMEYGTRQAVEGEAA